RTGAGCGRPCLPRLPGRRAARRRSRSSCPARGRRGRRTGLRTSAENGASFVLLSGVWNRRTLMGRARWVKAAAWPGSKEVSDGEFKQVRVVDGPPCEREPDFEPERPQGREPAQAETGAHEEPERKGAAALGALEEVLLLRVHVSGVVEDDAPQPGAAEDGELDLPVGDQLLVAADRELDDRRVGLADGGDRQRGRDAAQ